MTSTAVELLEPEQISHVVRHWKTNDAAFSNALQSGVAPAVALARLGIRLCLLQRYPESLAVLNAAVALSPNDPLLLNNLAVVLDRAGQTDHAILVTQRSLALLPAQADSWLLLGNMKKMRGDLAGARTAYETCLSLEASSPLAWQGLGLIKQAQREFPEAIQCFINCIKQSQPTAPLLAILGQLFYVTGQFEKSRDAYAGALHYDPQHSLYHHMHREMLFLCAVIRGDSFEDAINAYLAGRLAHPEPSDKDLPELFLATFSLLSAFGPNDAARRVGAKCVELFPASATAAYLLDAVAGDSSITRCPDAYLVEYFDHFADQFDHQLVQALGYDIPRKLGQALAGFVPAGSKFDVLDAGCGTGLCGPHVRDFAASLTGVDLSPRMLDHARQRQIYDRLVCSELTAFLNASPAAFQAIIAADVLIYFGDLAPLADALAHALQPGGLVAFSIERTAAPTYQLLTSGRFAHNPAYIHSIFAPAFTPCASLETTIRLEAAHPVPGHLFLFRRH